MATYKQIQPELVPGVHQAPRASLPFLPLETSLPSMKGSISECLLDPACAPPLGCTLLGYSPSKGVSVESTEVWGGGRSLGTF